jgi:CubicO group peptidase (beta-lactamase class C family)
MFEHDPTDPHEVGLNADRLAAVPAFFEKNYLDTGKLPCMATLISRNGEIALEDYRGTTEFDGGKPIGPETIFRIYSMTKPITSLAAMMLFEEGKLRLEHDVARYIPEFADVEVFDSGSREDYKTRKPDRPMKVLDLFTHTSGLTYGFMESNPVDALYRSRGIDFNWGENKSLQEVIDKLVEAPLIAQPGTEWNYSVATDVLGYLVQQISGEPFDVFLREKVIKPLGMVDTDFFVPADKLDRFACNYTRKPDGSLGLIDDAQDSPRYNAMPPVASGGGGLCSTAHDYMRFCLFMLNEGELDGVRLLGRKTVELMTSNHLDGDMADMGQPTFSESPYYGIGFGLGFSVTLDPAKAQILGSAGEYAWGGAASTAFWCDPEEDMAVVFLTQLMPSSTYPVRRELRVLTYQAIVD